MTVALRRILANPQTFDLGVFDDEPLRGGDVIEVVALQAEWVIENLFQGEAQSVADEIAFELANALTFEGIAAEPASSRGEEWEPTMYRFVVRAQLTADQGELVGTKTTFDVAETVSAVFAAFNTEPTTMQVLRVRDDARPLVSPLLFTAFGLLALFVMTRGK